MKIGDAAAVKIGSSLKAEGSLREVAGMADPRTRTFRARIAFKETPAGIRLGMSADVTISVPLVQSGVLIPPEALCDGRGTPIHVWIVGADGVAQARPVETEGVQEGLFVVSGVNPGEKIVVDGARFLTTPGKVRVAQDNADGEGK